MAPGQEIDPISMEQSRDKIPLIVQKYAKLQEQAVVKLYKAKPVGFRFYVLRKA